MNWKITHENSPNGYWSNTPLTSVFCLCECGTRAFLDDVIWGLYRSSVICNWGEETLIDGTIMTEALVIEPGFFVTASVTGFFIWW